MLRIVIKGGAVNTTSPFCELVTEIELGIERVVVGELVIVISIVDVSDGLTETTGQFCQIAFTKWGACPTFYCGRYGLFRGG